MEDLRDFHKLPQELVVEIFKYFTSKEVSKYFTVSRYFLNLLNLKPINRGMVLSRIYVEQNQIRGSKLVPFEMDWKKVMFCEESLVVTEFKEIERKIDLEKKGVFYEALYDYDAQTESEMTLVTGEVYKILDKHEDGWWHAENHSKKDGVKGYIPYNFLTNEAIKSKTTQYISMNIFPFNHVRKIILSYEYSAAPKKKKKKKKKRYKRLISIINEESLKRKSHRVEVLKSHFANRRKDSIFKVSQITIIGGVL